MLGFGVCWARDGRLLESLNTKGSSSGFAVQGCRIRGWGFQVLGFKLACTVQGLGFRAGGLEFRVSGYRVRD